MSDERPRNGLRGRDLAGLGGLLVGAVVGGMVLGLLADSAAGTSPLWTLVGIGIGISWAASASSSASAARCGTEVAR
jgi:F0F1-type ATP synthase assembly protein I